MKTGKNHYQVLGIPIGSSLADIKKAYRRLALVFHPDKHPDPLIAIPKFNEIKEAYEVLSDPSSRRTYDIEFHFQKYQPKEPPLASNADEVLLKCKAFWDKLRKQDPFRIDQDLLFFEQSQLLSPHHIRLLNNKANPTLDKEVIQYLMDASMALSMDQKQRMSVEWKKIARDHSENLAMIQDYLQQANIWSFWDKYKMAMALTLALLICMGIYLMG